MRKSTRRYSKNHPNHNLEEIDENKKGYETDSSGNTYEDIQFSSGKQMRK